MTLGWERFQNPRLLDGPDKAAGPVRAHGVPISLSSKPALAMVGRVAGAADVVVGAVADVVDDSVAEVVPVETVSVEVSDEVTVVEEMATELVAAVDTTDVSASAEAETLEEVRLGLHGPAMTTSAARRTTSLAAMFLKEGITMAKKEVSYAVNE